ncbi:MAG: Ppx/GppA family phosphatase [bacterium]
MLAAAIDLGSNSARLLISEVNNSEIREIFRKKITTRLGAGIKKDGSLSSEARECALHAIQQFQKEIKKFQVDQVKIIGTSALRDINNRDQIKNIIKKKFGYDLEVVSGKDEACLVYKGVSLDFKGDNFLVIDIGGGSTEFIWKNEQINFKSLDLGAVRLTKNYVSHPYFPLTDQEKKTLKKVVYREVDRNLPSTIKLNTTLGVGGTITTLGAIKQKLIEYKPEKIHKFNLTAVAVEEIFNNVANCNLEDRKKIKGLEPQRADIIPAGVLILQTVMSYFDIDNIMISEKDLLYGISRLLYKI